MAKRRAEEQTPPGQIDPMAETMQAMLDSLPGLDGLPTAEEIKRATEIYCLATVATKNLVRLADVASGSNQVGSMGTLNDVVQSIRDLPCVREAVGIVKAISFMGTLVVEARSTPPGA